MDIYKTKINLLILQKTPDAKRMTTTNSYPVLQMGEKIHICDPN